MTRRTIRTITGANHSAKIQYYPGNREYRVTVSATGQTVGPEESAYYTDDKGDAIATGEAMILAADIQAQKARIGE